MTAKPEKIANMPRGPTSRPRQGFSLIEVTLALGIVSFAMVTLLGLIPVGLKSFQSAMRVTVESQIVRAVVTDINLKDYSTLGFTEYFFDVEGTPEQTSSKPVYTASLSFQSGVEGMALDASSVRVATIDITSTVNPKRVSHYTVLVANNGR